MNLHFVHLRLPVSHSYFSVCVCAYIHVEASDNFGYDSSGDTYLFSNSGIFIERPACLCLPSTGTTSAGSSLDFFFFNVGSEG